MLYLFLISHMLQDPLGGIPSPSLTTHKYSAPIYPRPSEIEYEKVEDCRVGNTVMTEFGPGT